MDALTVVKARNQKAPVALALLSSIAILVGCGDSQMAFFSGDTQAQTVSLIREQEWLGGPWQSTLIVANSQQCQRRYPLEELSASKLRMGVYRPQPSAFILNSGKHWYVVELQACGFQVYRAPPPVPGVLIGNFELRNDKLVYLVNESEGSVTGGVTRSPVADK